MNIKDLFDADHTEGYIIECLVDFSVKVWADPELEVHRWYSLQECVVEYEGTYFRYSKYIITGDACMEDMDLEYSLDDFDIVQKKERVVTETYYG